MIDSEQKNKISKQSRIILIVALAVRIFLLLVNEFLFTLPFCSESGDISSFDQMAKNIANNMTILTEDYIYGGMYSKLLGVLYYCFGDAKILAEMINVLLSVATIYFIFQIMSNLEFKNSNIELFLKLLIAFFPVNMILSICLLRESIIVFFIIVSLKYCLDYIKTNKRYKIFISFIAIMIAGMFHSGTIFITVGYILIFAFYNYDEKKIKVCIRNVIKFIISIVIFIFIMIQFSNLFATKLVKNINVEETKQEDMENVEEGIIKNNAITRALEKTSDAGSSYLKGRIVNNIFDLVIFSAERVIYFMFSPMPWDCRGLTDAIVFLIDSMLYIVLIISILTSFRKMNQTKLILILFLILGLCIDLAVFALGTYTAGAALRHRNKFLYYLLIISMLCNTKEMEDSNA